LRVEEELRAQGVLLLRQALNNPDANFRPDQWEAIEHLVLRQARLLVVQRTGWGKSMVYFLATYLLRRQQKGPSLLISPLLSLMRNQIEAAERLGIRAVTVNSSNQEEWSKIKSQLEQDRVDIILISPERLANDEFREAMLLPVVDRIGLFVVDEAHCISDWGHDFRPDYRRIKRILQLLPLNIPVLATTATANDRVVTDIQKQLGYQLIILRGSLVRESLRLQVIHLPGPAERMAWLAEQLPRLPGSGIIYVLTVRDAEQIAKWLRDCGTRVEAYHADSKGNREQLEQALLNNQLKALVATSALGMGFDKPDLGFVVHYQRPGSVIHYYQQVGRAGRSLTNAYGILLGGDEDQAIIDYFIETTLPQPDDIEAVWETLNESAEGLTVSLLTQRVNLRISHLEKILTILSTEIPAPVSKRGHLWHANPVNYQIDREKIAVLRAIRRQEQQRMLAYANTSECLMAFLVRELDEVKVVPCSRCANCLKKPLFSKSFSGKLLERAKRFLETGGIQIIEPRRQWPGDALIKEGWQGKIPVELQAQPGRALCIWGSGKWGELVKNGKQQTDCFDEQLVTATIALIVQQWHPEPYPTWVTCVPSLGRPELVANFAEQVAEGLKLPFRRVVRQIRKKVAQKTRQNGYQQAHNLALAFTVEDGVDVRGPVLLIDDIVDSGWTLTVVSALLRRAGSGLVFPFVLATASSDS